MNKYQTIYLRFVALIIDSFVLIFFLAFGEYVKLDFTFANLSPQFFNFAVNIGVWVAFTAYYVLMHAFFGRTIGKYLAGIKVVSANELKINLGQAMIRSLPQIIPVIIILGFYSRYLMTGEMNQKEIQINNAIESLLNIGVLLWTILNIIFALSDSKHRALHDHFAETVVVKSS